MNGSLIWCALTARGYAGKSYAKTTGFRALLHGARAATVSILETFPQVTDHERARCHYTALRLTGDENRTGAWWRDDATRFVGTSSWRSALMSEPGVIG